MMMQERHPKGLWLFSLGEFWERLSFFGTLIFLVLYTKKEFILSDSVSFTIYGTFLSLSFALPLIGGFIADRWLGARHAMLLGLALLCVGNALLGFSHLWSFYLALATINVGTGLYKPTCTACVGNLYVKTDPKRERGYSLFYVAMNVGATLGPLIYAGVVAWWGWHSGFLVSSVGMFLIGILFYFCFDEKVFTSEVAVVKPSRQPWVYLVVLSGCGLFSLLFAYASFTQLLFLFFALVIFIGFVWYAHRQEKTVRNQLYGVAGLFVFAMFFFVASLQVGSTINLFLLRDVPRTLWGWNIPTTGFGALDPFFVVVCAPFFSWLWNRLAKINREPKVTAKIIFALILAALGLVCFTMAGHSILNGARLTLLWIVLGYFGLGAGEICLAPAIFNAASRYVPSYLASSMTGLMYLFIAFGSYLGSMIATISDQTNLVKQNLSEKASVYIYMHTFMIIAAVTLFAALLLYFFSRKIQRLLG